MAKATNLWSDAQGNQWFPIIKVSDPKAQNALEAFQKANAEAKARREALEKLLMAKLEASTPEGHEPIISYRFGKMSVAYKPKGSGKSADAEKAGITL